MHNIDASEAIPETLAYGQDFFTFLLHHYYLRIGFASSRALTVQGKVGKSLGQGFVLFFLLVDLTLRLTDGLQQGVIGLLPGQKLSNHFLNISYLCSGFNRFESLVNCRAFLHLFFHLFTHELVPQLRNEQLVPQHQLRTIFVLIGRRLSNLSVSALAFNSSVDGLLFIFYWLLQLWNSILSDFLFLLDVYHQAIEDGFWLKFSFFCFLHLLGLCTHDVDLWLGTNFKFRGGDASGNEILFHSFNHVLVTWLCPAFLIDFFLSLDQRFFQLLNPWSCEEDRSLGVFCLLLGLILLFYRPLKLSLSRGWELLCVIMFFFNHVELIWNLFDLIGDVLGRWIIVSWVQQCVNVDCRLGTIVIT